MKYIFEFQWRNELRRTTSRDKGGGNKLRTYVNFKKTVEYEQYLNIQSTFALRKNITKLRTSSHKLEVEVGRYISKNKKQKLNVIREFVNNATWVRSKMKNTFS